MTKFWSPVGSDEQSDCYRYRTSAIIRFSAVPDSTWITLEVHGRAFSVAYPTTEARDADLKRLIKALEAE